MKKIYIIAAMLLTVAAAAQQRTFVKSLKTDHVTKQVTLNISWAAGSRGTSSGKVYNSKVWVLVDYQEFRGDAPYGAWQRADIDLSNLPANCTADATNTKGFWYQGQTSSAQNADITITLTGVPAQFKWCAYASDSPPSAVYNGSTTFTLRGTTPFYITYQGESPATVNAKTYTSDDSKEIVAMIDATGCPAGCKMRNQAISDGACCSGLTAVGGYCRDLTADKAVKFSGCGYDLEVETMNRIPSASWWTTQICPSGWRQALVDEYQCFWSTPAFAGNTNMVGSCWYMTNTYVGNCGHVGGVTCSATCSAYWMYCTYAASCDGACQSKKDARGVRITNCTYSTITAQYYKCVR